MLSMNMFSPSEFFNWSGFAHSSLFDDNKPVWEVLKIINEYLLSCSLGNILGVVEKGAYLVNPEQISIGQGTVVESGAYIRGPCIIGERCEVRHGAYIRGDLITGNRCVIGHSTEIKNSLLMDGVQAGHFAYVGDSILGHHVNLGAGTKCANLRFDHQNIPIIFENRKIDTGLRKFGAIFGDHAQTGCNSVTNPGTLMGQGSSLAPCTTVHGVVPKNHIVKSPESVMLAADR